MENKPQSSIPSFLFVIFHALSAIPSILLAFHGLMMVATGVGFMTGMTTLENGGAASVVFIKVIYFVIGFVFIIAAIAISTVLMCFTLSRIKKRKPYIIWNYVIAVFLALLGVYMFYEASVATGFFAGLAEVLMGVFFIAIAVRAVLSLSLAITALHFIKKIKGRKKGD